MTEVQIKCFLNAAKYENFTKAAEEMFITQPVLGRHIANLEAELGVQLFRRERKTVRLTRHGGLLADFFVEYEERLDKIIENIRAEQRASKQRLIIASIPGQRIGDIYSPVIQYLDENAPELELSISYIQTNDLLLDELEGGKIDIAITSKDEMLRRSDNFNYHELLRFEVGLIVPANNPILLKPDLKLEDFKDECFITISDKEPLSKLALESIMERIGTTKFLVADDLPTYMLMLESGRGISGTTACHKLSVDPRFRFIPHDNPIATNIAVAIWSKTSSNPCIDLFLQACRSTGFYLSDKD
ncbi:MAG: LysR family transcriptional regulator [Oscillospiraceae bacterium]|nr:LysR family transcriptional regulator [Oscillospiraceae bacterium]